MTSLCDACKNGYKIGGTGYSTQYHCCKKKVAVFAHWGDCDDYESKRSGN